jgi:hypothetical protein
MTVLNAPVADTLTPQNVGSRRQPCVNTARGVLFILKGADKRRSIAYNKARLLQQELGVIPRLVKVTL